MQPLAPTEWYAHQRNWIIEGRDAFWSAMVGPYGCGKTGGAILWAWMRSRLNWGRRGLWIEPTFGMIRDIVLPELEEFLDALEMEEALGKRGLRANEYRLNRSGRPELELPWGVWMFRSGEIPARLKGPTVAWALLDEADMMDKSVEDIVLSRVRDPRADFKAIGHVGTPETFGSWLHERCEGDAQQKADHVVRAKREDVTGLGPQYYERMKDSYDALAYEQYAEGRWVLNTEGLIYVPPFSAENIQSWEFVPSLPVLVGMDFNVDPFSFVANQYADGKLHAFKQYRLKGANSEMAARVLRNDFPDSVIEVWCDRAGTGRHTSGLSGTDVQILRRHLGENAVNYTTIRFVNDRYNSTRAMLCNANGVRRLFVDPSCKQYIRELQTLTYAEAAKAGADNHTTSAEDYLVLGKFHPTRDNVRAA